MTLKELYDEGIAALDESGIESPEVDAFYLLEFVTGISRTRYLLYKDMQIEPQAAAKFREMIGVRAEHVPYQYITGTADFMGYKFHVTPDVLIPRLDTEVLCEEAARLISGKDRVLDMCTGSGCLAIALKKLCPGAKVTACDISDKALEVAQVNAELNESEITFIQSDLFAELGAEMFDCIVSNPPYVTEGEFAELAAEVKDHEPSLALLAGADGLDIYRRLIPESGKHLNPGGWLVMEIGCFQGEAVKALMENSGYKDIKLIKDLAGLDRVILGNNTEEQK